MTTDDDDLEHLLRGLPLRRPPAALDGRVATAVRPRRSVGRWVAVAAALLFAVGLTWRWATPRSAVPVATPTAVVSIERVTSHTVDDGVVRVDGDVPYRQVREQTVREVWWADPATGARLWARVPAAERVTVEPAETF